MSPDSGHPFLHWPSSPAIGSSSQASDRFLFMMLAIYATLIPRTLSLACMVNSEVGVVLAVMRTVRWQISLLIRETKPDVETYYFRKISDRSSKIIFSSQWQEVLPTSKYMPFLFPKSRRKTQKTARYNDTEVWIIPAYDNSTWSVKAVSFISATSAVLATCFFVGRHCIRWGITYP